MDQAWHPFYFNLIESAKAAGMIAWSDIAMHALPAALAIEDCPVPVHMPSLFECPVEVLKHVVERLHLEERLAGTA